MKGAKTTAVNRKAKGYAKSEDGYKGGYNLQISSYDTGGKFVNVCDSQSVAPQPQPVHQNSDEGKQLVTTSWNGYAGNFGGTGHFGGLDLFCLDTTKFGARAEDTTGEIPHVEQHGTTNTIAATSGAVEIANIGERKCTQSYTISDAINIAVQKRHAQRQTTNEDRRMRAWTQPWWRLHTS